MIKRLFTACAVTIAALAFFSCKPGEDSASISVSESRLDFSADGETLSFIIETSDQNMTWTITTDGQDWYTVSPESGTGNARVEVTAEVYLESTTREALLTVSADGASDQEIRIQQLTPVDPTMVTFYSLTEAEQESIGMINSRVTAVSGNGKWAVAVDEDMGYQAMLWSYETREFMDLNDGSQSTCNASDVSNEGMIVGGSGYYSDGVWSDLPDGNPRFISDDGHVVGGTSAGEPTIWIDFVKQPPLENLPPEEDRGQFGLMMLGMSEDGSVICGKTEWPNGMVSPAVHANGTLTRIYGESMEAEYFYFGGVREMIQNSSEEHLNDYYRKRISRGIWSNAIRIRGAEDELEYMPAKAMSTSSILTSYFPYPTTEKYGEDITQLRKEQA